MRFVKQTKVLLFAEFIVSLSYGYIVNYPSCTFWKTVEWMGKFEKKNKKTTQNLLYHFCKVSY